MFKNRTVWLIIGACILLIACSIGNNFSASVSMPTSVAQLVTVVITTTPQPTTPTLTPTRTSTPIPTPTRTLVPPVARQADIASDPLTVVLTSPGDKSENISASKETTRIVAQFNHPVVPLSAIELQSDLPQPFTFDPPLAGQGKWINTSTFAFTPTSDLVIAARYQVTIESVRDILGQTLNNYTWSFTTTSPAVLEMNPAPNTKFVGIQQPITVTFNTEMDPLTTVTRWSLRRADTLALVEGRFQFDGDLFRFFPSQLLEHNSTYIAKLDEGAQDARKSGRTAKISEWKFMTVPEPGVKTAITDGQTDVRGENLFRLSFNSPMDPDAVRVTVVPTLTYQSLYWSWGEALDARLSASWEPSTAYTVTIHADSQTRDGDALAQDVIVHFKTAPRPPDVSFAMPGVTGMYDVNGPQKLFASYVNVNQVDFQLYRIDRQTLLELNGYGEHRAWWSKVSSEKNKLQAWSRSVGSPLNTWGGISTTLGFDGQKLDAGMYMLEAKSSPATQPDYRQILVTDLNFALKHTESEVLVWATSFQTGKPVANQRIAVYEGGDDAPLAAGITDKDGVWRARIQRRNENASLLALSESGNRVIAAVGSDWDTAMQVWDFDVPASSSMQNFYANVYTDRAIYRPGQTVYVRGIVRRDQDAAYSLFDELETVTLTLRDSNAQTLVEHEVRLNRFGTFNDEIKLGDDAAIGEYSFELDVFDRPREFSKQVYFRVAEYRRPEFLATMQTDRDSYQDGDTIKLTGDATYYFGGGVGDADLTWTVSAENLGFYPPNLTGNWEFNDYDAWSETNYRHGIINSGTAKTKKDGSFQIEIPAMISDLPTSQNFTIQVEIADINNQSISLNTTVPVHRARVYVGVRPQRYVGVVGEDQTLELMTVNPQGITVTQQSLAVSFFQREWFSVRQRDTDGMFFWKNSYTDTLVSKINVTTKALGLANARFKPPRGGYYKILVETQDAKFHAVRAATFVWISGDAEVHWRQENHDRIQLIADKKIYAPGDTAEVLIPAPFRNAEALLTIERGTIRQVQHLTLRGNSDRVKIPITSNDAPDVFVSVMLFKGRGADGSLPQFKIGYTQLAIETREKELHVEVTPDRTTPYAPGDIAMFTITAKDFSGKPVQAEFSVALVDKAVQALVGDNSEALLTSFYSDRPLSVHTATTLVLSVDRVIQDMQLGAKGGGGGGPAFDQSESVRRNFRDTAYWNANVVTDASGRAWVTIPLPDNLTTWNLTAKGITTDTRVGDARLDIVSTKPLLVRPVTPRFFVVNDQVQLETVVHNNTDQNTQTQVRLDATGLIVRDPLTQALTIPAHDKLKAHWNVIVTSQDQVVMRFSAASAALRDAVEQTLPVRLPISMETVATAGQVDTRTVERIQLPTDTDARAGELRVELNPSLAAASRASLKYLDSFDYECSEQTVSKFFPNVATYRALKELGIEREDLRRGLEANVLREVQRLYALQRNDGGWGWWYEDRSRPTLTAYALLGLYNAHAAGFTVDEKVMQSAEKFLMRYLDERTDARAASTFDERAFVLFVLAEMDRPITSRAVGLFDQRANASQYGKAFLLMTLHRLHQPQADTLKSELTSAAILSASGAHWEESFRDVWAMNTDTRTTAIVVMALARSDPKNVALANAVRWLMIARKEGHWETTQSTAWSVLALTDFMTTTGELNANYTFRATMNGTLIGQGQVEKANVDQTRVLTVAVKDLLASTANDLIITRDGDGRLYYSAYLNYFMPVEKMQALSRGILVTREYESVDPITLKPTGRSIQSAKVGDYIRVTLSVIAPNDVYYFALEDPLPAGLEAVDTELATTNLAAISPQLREKSDGRIEYLPYWSYWAHTEMRDDRVAAFATYLPRGTYEYVYLARASVAGEFRALPARAWEMYFPDVFGRSAGGLFTITNP